MKLLHPSSAEPNCCVCLEGMRIDGGCGEAPAKSTLLSRVLCGKRDRRRPDFEARLLESDPNSYSIV